MAAPRVVIVSRHTALESLQRRYGSINNASYALSVSDSIMESASAGAAIAGASLGNRGDEVSYQEGQRRLRRVGATRSVSASNQSYKAVSSSHTSSTTTMTMVSQAIPPDWRVARIEREHISTFFFEPDDVVICVGPDGLVANVAKYLFHGQRVIGVKPYEIATPGILVPWDPGQVKLAISMAMDNLGIETRCMVEAVADTGQTLVALNEIYVGHRSHQSARYNIEFANVEEKQSSSGLIAFTGTGATGWAKSMFEAYAAHPPKLPGVAESMVGYFVREPWVSAGYTASLRSGLIGAGSPMVIRSEIEEGGVVFGDGIEEDYLELAYGRVVALQPSQQVLSLVTPRVAQDEEEMALARRPRRLGRNRPVGHAQN